MPPKRKDLTSVVHIGQEYKVGDCILINPDADAPAYIGRIRRMVQRSSIPNDVELEVTWFYRPEEVIGGRKIFHGEAEVFDSDHQDKVPLGSVLGRCFIHTLERYEMLQEHKENDFYSRMKYRSRTQQFEPDQVPIYCTCEMPYNPDRPMVMCTACEDWFHPKCLRLGPEVFQDAHFTCPTCAERSAGSRAVAE
ncbi:hypothetical protein Agub_g5532 [Astrephomene gubernaculifera]|uniref:Uncharacterized protein n=1 Tax=Astrephomene gubernaculifera TaxID=47775 RepID=A0AAD3DM10_9CHLO|nr:hypothetical protein Agub_g5532 [Astrephomene gubernaculifera]